MHLPRMLTAYFTLSIIKFFIIVLTKYAVLCEYTHEWAVQIQGGEEDAKMIAEKHDFQYLGKIFPDVFYLRHRRLVKRSANPSQHHHENLLQESLVKWAEQQRVKKRVKRDLLAFYGSPISLNDKFSRRDTEDKVHTDFSDPKWPSMWYLNRGGHLDMNVERAWRDGITGKGIVVTILDDGLEKDHPDLIQNYDPNASYDVNGRDPDPEPRYDLLDSNRHGTRCAGEVAADANNTICAVGVAYEASVGGVRMLDGDVTDAVEAHSLALNPQHIDIYSASWGPDDDGKTVDGPGQLATRAFIEGITRGRNGKGSIFVWASGNGGNDEDNCNCDGYTNSIWTLSISSATEKGRVPWYSEACSSTLASTYSSGALGERQIITTDLHHRCTTSHTGTSASAPLAAGICALALQANTFLTWRDMQHVVVRTARPENLDAPDWQTNGVGRKVSHRFGYGLMDAFAMVKLARNWTTVPPQRKCEIPSGHIDKLIPQKSYVTLNLEVSDCPGVVYLEHVQAKVTLMADRRGDIEIFLISPAGTKSNLLALRPKDNSRAGFHSWPFMTVHMWGESPLGIWKLEIHNNGLFYTTTKAKAQDWKLIFYGTEVEPGRSFSGIKFNDNSIDDEHRSSHSIHSEGGRAKVSSSSREQETRTPQQSLNQETSLGTKGDSSAGDSVVSTGVSYLGNYGCASINSIGQCLECGKDYFLYEGSCVHNCPLGYFSSNTAPKSCLRCHFSCKTCTGPQDYQCQECWPDASLYKQKEKSFCHSVTSVDAYDYNSSWWLEASVVLFFILFIMLLFLIFTTCRKKTKDSEETMLQEESGNNSSTIIMRKKPVVNKNLYYPVGESDSEKRLEYSSSDEEL